MTMYATVLSVRYHIWLCYTYDSRESVLEVETEDPWRDSRTLPDECASFSYYSTLEATLDIGGVQMFVENTNTSINESKLFWIDGTLVTPNEVIDAGDEVFVHLFSRPAGWLDIHGDEKIIVQDRLGVYHYFEEGYQEILSTH